jgi:hypothetical protein
MEKSHCFAYSLFFLSRDVYSRFSRFENADAGWGTYPTEAETLGIEIEMSDTEVQAAQKPAGTLAYYQEQNTVVHQVVVWCSEKN